VKETEVFFRNNLIHIIQRHKNKILKQALFSFILSEKKPEKSKPPENLSIYISYIIAASAKISH